MLYQLLISSIKRDMEGWLKMKKRKECMRKQLKLILRQSPWDFLDENHKNFSQTDYDKTLMLVMCGVQFLGNHISTLYLRFICTAHISKDIKSFREDIDRKKQVAHRLHNINNVVTQKYVHKKLILTLIWGGQWHCGIKNKRIVELFWYIIQFIKLNMSATMTHQTWLLQHVITDEVGSRVKETCHA